MVMLIPTSQQAWETLEASFASHSTARVMHIRTELGKLKKHDFPNATAYFNKVKSLSDVLSSVGQPLRPDEFNTFLLNGLDSEYDALADRVGARPVHDPLPVCDVYAQLLNTEQSVEARRPEISSDNHHANYTLRPGGSRAPPYQPRQEQPAPYTTPAHAPNGGGPQGQQGRPMGTGGTRPICQICTKTGHVASCCFKRYDKNYLGAGNDVRNKERHLAALSTTTTGSTPSYLIDPSWYADMGATDHLTNDLNNLTMKEQYHGKDNVQTANGTGLGRGARLELLDDTDDTPGTPLTPPPCGAAPAADPRSPDIDRMGHAGEGSTSPGHVDHSPDSVSQAAHGPSSPDAAHTPGLATSTTAAMSYPSPTPTVPTSVGSDTPPPAPKGVVTRLQRGIRQQKIRTDGTVAWNVTRSSDSTMLQTEPTD
ncbi:hypothetical protein QYE76_028625 [Lolium multiflorum]|uniref:Uncharacterized protein n=1 Tax=Lolium multiflorum TaxID=4521 RepID=A0AAD8VES1_LOLMU|nr:hypothetical protein QYE76_028625 [Lolium multiflorum]